MPPGIGGARDPDATGWSWTRPVPACSWAWRPPWRGRARAATWRATTASWPTAHCSTARGPRTSTRAAGRSTAGRSRFRSPALPSTGAPDTAGYLDVASHSLFSLGFWAGARPPALPLLYKVLPDSDSARAWGQFAVSVVCWPLLAGAVARCLRPGVYRYLAFGAVLLFSMTIPIIQWDRVLLSESLSISLTALVLASWLELVRAPRPAMVFGVLAASVLWVFARDSNGIVALTIVPFALAWAVWPGHGRRVWPLALAGGLAAIFVTSF